MTGVNGVEISGYGFYDVTFNKVFNMNTAGLGSELAYAATQTLWGLFSGAGVLSNSLYDYNPNTVSGCDMETYCIFKIKENYSPGSSQSSFWMFENKDAANDIRDGIAGHIGAMPTYMYPGTTYAEWTESSLIATPVPASLFLLAPALMGAIGLRRKAKIALNVT
ncbi:hypothetical protein [Methylophaga sp.]|uniref:hypothetical protein n=1 Tax=Methylophaga sp. TaxID=2024840 RepID=UPI003A9118C5